MKKLPIGIQTFENLINKGYYCVDKTPFVQALADHGKYYFLCRPRRFGKSLFLSTIKAGIAGISWPDMKNTTPLWSIAISPPWGWMCIRKWLRSLLFCALLGVWCPCLAVAADTPHLYLELSRNKSGRQLLTLEAESVPLSKLLHRIGKTTEIDIRLWQEIPDPVNASFDQKPVREIFEALCSNFALVSTIDPVSGQYRIVGLDALPKTSESSIDPTRQPDTSAKQQTRSDGAVDPVPDSRDRPNSHFSSFSPRPAFVPSELLIRFAPHVSPETRQSLHDFLDSRVLERIPSLHLTRVKLAADLSEEEAVRLYTASGVVEIAEKHALRYVQETVPNDPKFSDQQMPQRIDLPRAWNLTQGSEEVVVAVIDTGVDFLHPDLQANIWVNVQESQGEPGVDDDGNGYVDDFSGYDFADRDADVADVDGHGTHVTGIIGAVGNNGLGVSGLNWQVRIMPLKVQSDDSSTIREFDVIEALEYALDQGVKIINCSFGGEQFNGLEREAFVRVQEAGGLAICAAGNDGLNIDGTGNELYPASYDLPSIITVAAGDSDGSGQPILADFSNYGTISVDLLAPGTSILSTAISGQPTNASVQTFSQNIPAQGLTFAGTTDEQGINGQLVDCGYGYEQEIPQTVAQNIALIKRGGLDDDSFYFYEKVENVQAQGAVAAIIYNDESGNFKGTLVRPDDWIPAVSISRADGQILKYLTLKQLTVLNHPQEGSDRYERLSGTSMAAAVASGALGLLQAWRPDVSPSDLKQTLLENVDPVMNAQSLLVSGGRLNVYKAMADLVLPGDVNLNGDLGLEDAVFCLQLLTSKTMDTSRPWRLADVNGDGNIDVIEVEHVLRNVQKFESRYEAKHE